MTLAKRYDAILDVCFRPQPPTQALQEVGEPERWRIYRRMVRARLERLLATALPRTAALVGEDSFRVWTDTWFDERAPRTRYFWRVVMEFADFVSQLGEPADSAAMELLRYEATRWHVRYDEAAPDAEAVNIDFERIPFVNPTLRLLEVEHPVHRELREGEAEYPRAATTLAVFRRMENDEVVTWTLNPMATALVQRWRLEDCTLSQGVREVASARGVSMTQSYLESLAGLLEGLLERGLLLGSR